MGGGPRRHGELGEAVRHGLELQQRRQLDVHVGLAHLGLHDRLHRLRVQHAHGDVLRDDLLALALQVRLEGLGREDAVVLVLAARVVSRRGGGGGGGGAVDGVHVEAGDALRRVRGRRRRGDGHGEDGHAVFLGQAEGRGHRIGGGFEGSLERYQGELEVDRVVGFGGLNGPIV